jgi:hypothetical protein
LQKYIIYDVEQNMTSNCSLTSHRPNFVGSCISYEWFHLYIVVTSQTESIKLNSSELITWDIEEGIKFIFSH